MGLECTFDSWTLCPHLNPNLCPHLGTPPAPPPPCSPQASEDLLRLREALDSQSFATPLMQLQQRTWLMHWALHVFWNTENGKTSLIDLFLQPAYMSAIQINAQHLLRYLAAAVVLNRKRRNNLRDLIKVIQQEAYEYSDPITQVRENTA